MNRRPRSLKAKLLVPLVAAGVVASLFSLWAIYETLWHQHTKKLNQRAELVANMVNNGAEFITRPGELQRLVAAIGAEPDVNLIIVVGGDPTRVLASTQHKFLYQLLNDLPLPHAREDLEKSIRTRQSSQQPHQEQSEIVFIAPIFLSQSTFADGVLNSGAVIVHMNTKLTEFETRRSIFQFSSIYLTLLTLFAILGYTLLQKQVLLPITSISRLVQNIQSTDPDALLATATDDEIGGLAQTLHAALHRADAAMHDLQNQKFALDQHAIVSVTDTKGRIAYANDRFCSISQYSLEELVGQDHRLINSGTHPKEFFTQLWTTIGNGEVWHGEICNRAKNGDLYWVDSTIVPLMGANGKPKNYISIRTDISNRVRAELAIREAKQTAEAANQAKSEFLANMSHEIRTPMNGITGMTNLLLASSLNEKQRYQAQTVRECGQSLLTLINDILDLSKIEAGKLELELIDFNLFDLIHESVRSMTFRAQQKGLDLICQEPSSTNPFYKGDPGRIRQVFINMIGNAIKFTEQGQVTVRFEPTELPNQHTQWRLSVTDTGIGLSYEQQQKLFHKFTQGDSSTTRKYGGTGLGLSISRELTELMGGEIGVESKIGTGSTFWFCINLPQASAPITSVLPAHESPPKFNAHVLVVEDNPVNLAVARGMLEECAIESSSATNGRIAITALEQSNYDLIFMDCQMPGMDGFATTRLIRDPKSQVKNHSIPIIAMTANAMRGDREKCLAAGMDDYLTKPLEVDSLRKTLKHWLPNASALAFATNHHTQASQILAEDLIPPTDSDSDTAQQADTSVFNLDDLRRRTMNNENLAQNLIKVFLRVSPVQIERLKKQIKLEDVEQAIDGAHNIKGGAANMGGTALSKLAAQIEQAGINGDLDNMRKNVLELDNQFSQLRAAMEAALLEINPNVSKTTKNT